MVIAGGAQSDRLGGEARLRASTEPAMVIAGGSAAAPDMITELETLQRSRRW